jgi:hypothetical protein
MTAKSTTSPSGLRGAINKGDIKIPTIGTSSTNSHIENAGIHFLNGLIRSVNEIAHLPGQITRPIEKVVVSSVRYAFSSSQQKINAEAEAARKKQKALYDKSKINNTGGSDGAKPQVLIPPPLNPSPDYKFNLPPHKWSLPLEPDAVAPDTVSSRPDSHHATRRGRIWYYNGYVGPSSAPDYTTTGIYSPPAGQKGVSNKYGFQFMWNPETFSQNTAVNMSITPSGSDPSSNLTGFAAANSTMSFTLRLDRTNDFACAKSLVKGKIKSGTTDRELDKYLEKLSGLADIVPFYTVGNLTPSTPVSVEENIVNLLTYGTEADLEFLYRTINGTGWTGIGGRETSNIGYLMPSLIRLDLGNQNFVGVVSDIQVNHIGFTRDLVPIRTDVNITVDLRANIQQTTNNGAVGQ